MRPVPRPLSQALKMKELSRLIYEKRGGRGVSETGREAGLSGVVLAKAEMGEIASVSSYLKICSWLEVAVDAFVKTAFSETELRQAYRQEPAYLDLLAADQCVNCFEKGSPLRSSDELWHQEEPRVLCDSCYEARLKLFEADATAATIQDWD